ncbi:MAG: GntR family transcriptional regulator [Lentisphaeria bacterium]
MPRQKNKSEDVYARLRERVLQAEPGTRIPSVRELMREHGVSQGPVDQALRRLHHQHLLEARVGSGTFVARPPSAASADKHRVDLYLSNYPSLTVNWLRQGMQAGLAGTEFECAVHYFRYDRPVCQIGLDADREIAVIWPDQVTLSVADITFLSAMARQVIVLNLPMHSLPLSSICGDDDLGGALAAKHLADLGHRKMAMLVTQPADHPTIAIRSAGFLKQAKLMDVAAEIIDCGTHGGEAPTPNAYARMQNLLRAGRPAFTGLFVDTDTTVPAVYKAITESGLRIPHDLSVIGYDGIPEGEYYQPPLTTIGQDYRVWAQDTIRLLRHRLAAPQPPPPAHARMAPLLVTRASTAAPAAG